MNASRLIFPVLIWVGVCFYGEDCRLAVSKTKSTTKRSDNPAPRNPCQNNRVTSRMNRRIRITTTKASSAFPFTAVARLDTNCSAVAVTDRHVLTAARCVASRGRSVKKGWVGFLTTKGKFKWIPVKRVWHPEEWKKQDQPPATHDYALLVLKSKHRRPALPLVVMNQTSFTETHGTIHLSAFDDPHQPEHLLYRMCKADEVNNGLVFSDECYADETANGAGVYTQVYDFKSRNWRRVLVGIHHSKSGAQGEGQQRTATLWITEDIMESLCEWTRKTRYKLCAD